MTDPALDPIPGERLSEDILSPEMFEVALESPDSLEATELLFAHDAAIRAALAAERERRERAEAKVARLMGHILTGKVATKAELDKAEARSERLADALRAVEWAADRYGDSETLTMHGFCPACGYPDTAAHDPGCILNAALTDAPESGTEGAS